MTKIPFANSSFVGGQATDLKLGIANSFAASQSIDFRKSPSQFTLLGRPVSETASTIVDLVQNEVMTDAGVIYAMGDTGYIYSRTGTTWTNFGKIRNGRFGITYRQDQQTIYLASDTTVSSITTVNATPTLNVDFYGISQSTYNNTDTMGFNVNANQSTGTLTTALGTSISETVTALRYFQTDIEPLNKLCVWVVAKGTGNWTLTIHDGLNNVIGSQTITNASLNNGAFNCFIFSSPLRASVAPAAQTYHFHLTSSVNNGTTCSVTANDMRTADMQLWADRLITTANGIHPIEQIQQFVAIGNGRYLSVWEPLGNAAPDNTEWQRHKLQFPPEWEVCGIAKMNEYIAIACENKQHGGIIFWWDGLSSTYNSFTEIPEGAPYAIHSYNNAVYYEAGGAWYAISTVDSMPQKIRTLPFGENSYGNSNNSTVVYPYAATTRNGIQLMAWPSITTNVNIPYGVYSWGRVDTNFSNSFGYSYLLSTGSTKWSNTNNLTIGMIKNFGDTLHISWRDDSKTPAYGIDVVNSSSPMPRFAKWESVIIDNGFMGKDKQANYMNATWLDLPDGVQCQLKYSINRGTWIYSPLFSNTNTWLGNSQATYAKLSCGQSIAQSRYTEVQIGLDVYCDDNIYLSPTITSVNLIFDDLGNEVLQ